MILKKSRRILAFTLLLAMLLSILPPVAFGAETQSYEKATSIAVGDTVLLVCETAKTEFTSISSSSTKYGVGAGYTDAPAGTTPFEVVAGSSTNSFGFKFGEKYLTWSSGNSLNSSNSIDANSSWTVSFDSNGNATISNLATSSRTIRWNASSPRFACYTSGQAAIQLYKLNLSTCDHATATSEVKIPATCEEPGVIEWYCPSCCKTWTEDKEANGHNYVDGVCSVCHTPEPEAPAVVSYKLINLDEVKAGNYIIAAVRNDVYPTIYPATATINNDWTVSDGSIVAQDDTIYSDQLPEDAQVVTFTGNNTDGFQIGFNVDGEMRYLGYSGEKSRLLALDAKYSSVLWRVVEDPDEDDKGFALSSFVNEKYYVISQNGTSGAAIIRGYGSNTIYTGIYLFAEVPTEEEPDPTDPTDPAPTECPHANAVREDKASTCTEAGYIKVSCPDCGDIQTTELPLAPHNYDEGYCAPAPTCEDDGILILTCTACGIQKSSTVPATGHNPGEPKVDILGEPSCTVPGMKQTIVYCLTCNAELSNVVEPIPALGHNFVDGVCDRCSLVDPRKDFTLATKLNDRDQLVLYYPAGTVALGNTPSDTKLAPSTVTVKDGILSSELDTAVLGVSFADDTNFYLLGEGGSYLTTAESGNELFFSDTANDYSLWHLAPIEGTDLFNIMSTNAAYNGNKNQALEFYNGAFTVYGLQEKYADQYKFQLYTYGAEIIECDHNYVAGEPVPPTCTEDGYTTYTCSLCGDSYDEDFVDALNHDYVAGEPIPPTCTEDGYTVYTCSRCDDFYEDDYVPARHNYVAGTPVPPTCTEEGYTPYTCTVCYDETKDEFSQPTGHAWSDATCTTPSTCLNCGAKGGGYMQISSISELADDDQIVIVAKADNSYLALNTSISTKIPPVEVAVSGNSVTAKTNPLPVWTLEKVEGGFALLANGNYLSYGSGTNFKSVGTPYTWIFEDSTAITDEDIDSGITITASSTTTDDTPRGILYRTNGYNTFGAYAASNINEAQYRGELLIFKYVEGNTLPHEDVDGNNHCDNCDFAPMQDAVLYGRTLSVKGNIAINFYMCLSEAVIKDGNAYMEFTQEGREDMEPVKVYIKDCMVKRNAGHTHYSFPYEVAAKEMTDQITARFFYGGECVGTYTYSVKEYADNTFEKGAASAELEQLLKSMLHYGAASQLQFNYNTDRLANADLPETIDYSAVTIEGYPITAPQGTKQAYLSGISLLLESETTLRFFFTVNVSIDQFSASYLGKSLEVKERGGLYYVDVVDIAAQDLDETVTIKISDGTNQDVEIFFCPLSYCQSVKENASGIHSEILQDCVTALFLYNRDADAYFASVA